MAVDNDISSVAFVDIEEMKQVFSETGANLVAFIDPEGKEPYILETARDTAVKYLKYTGKKVCFYGLNTIIMKKKRHCNLLINKRRKNNFKKIHFNVRDKAFSNVYVMYENIFLVLILEI
jgi:hypothetical protein